MDAKTHEALDTVRWCLEAKRYQVTQHFQERMDRRGMVWADVLAVVDEPVRVRDDGQDDYGRQKWVIGGMAADGLNLDMVCVLDVDEHGDLTVFITIY